MTKRKFDRHLWTFKIKHLEASDIYKIIFANVIIKFKTYRKVSYTSIDIQNTLKLFLNRSDIIIQKAKVSKNGNSLVFNQRVVPPPQ